MSETFFILLTQADKRDPASVKQSQVDVLSAGTPWYNEAER